MEIISQTYDQSRLKYFKTQKAIAEGKLRWWKYRLNSPDYPHMYAHDMCSEYGNIISYYEDAISHFENKPQIDELLLLLEDDGK